jgi:hypothetical protein
LNCDPNRKHREELVPTLRTFWENCARTALVWLRGITLQQILFSCQGGSTVA